MKSPSTRMSIDLLGSAACISLVLAAYFFGIRGWLDGTAQAQRISQESAALARENQTNRETERTIEQSLDAINRGLADEGVTLADGEELTGRLIVLGSIAERAGVVIETLTPHPLETGEVFDRQPISLQCVGKYPDCVQLLHSIRAEDPTIIARSVALRRTGNGDDAALEAELVWFVRAESQGD